MIDFVLDSIDVARVARVADVTRSLKRKNCETTYPQGMLSHGLGDPE